MLWNHAIKATNDAVSGELMDSTWCTCWSQMAPDRTEADRYLTV